ncbi:hypothetical protein [Halorussus halophilus]|uniref:hypothetical protein n=1 Tax=Halorussus halophilus TaxID=2650975 RepID=UPI00130164EB|nr:hypothetical protein [Halorussus halophilus]
MSKDNKTHEKTFDRRSMLKTVGASAAAGLAATGSVSATVPTSEMNHVEAAYSDSVRAQWAVAEHADTVLAELADRGYLDARGADAFDFSAVGTDAKDASVMSLYKDERATAEVKASVETETHEVTVVVHPQLGESYASAKPLADADPITVRDEGGEVTTEACVTESRCTCDPCDLNSCVYQERTCCTNYGDGTDCTAWSDEGCCGACCS